MTKATQTMIAKFEGLLEDGQDYTKSQVMALLKTLSADKPKKSKNAYQYFMGDKTTRASLKEANPESSSKEMLALMAAHWKTLGDSDREPYATMAEDEKSSMPTETKTKDRSRGRTPYQCFMADKTARALVVQENPESPSKDILTIMAGKWKTFSDSEKEPYAVLSAEDKLLFPDSKTSTKTSKTSKTSTKTSKTPFDMFQSECARKAKAKAKAKGSDSDSDSDTDSDSDSDSDSEESIEEQWTGMSDSEKKKYVDKCAAAKSPKPKCARMMYLADAGVKAQLKDQHPEAKAAELTKLMSAQWKELEDKEPYEAAALKAKERHELLFSETRALPNLTRSVSIS